jgi:hypothetical protein
MVEIRGNVVIIEIVSCNVSIDQISADCLPYRLERSSEQKAHEKRALFMI